MSSLEEDLSKAIAELQALERIVSELQNRATALRALLTEYDGAIALLEELKNRKTGLNILIPIGGGNFLKAEIKDVEEGESIKAHEETIVNYAQRMEELRRIVQALSARLAELQKAQKEGK